jgi:hypothetical protein
MPFTSIKVGGPASIRLAQRLGVKGKGAIAARLRFARQYQLEAVAVGAEDEATMMGLADVGFTGAQGVWIQKPLSLDELLAWDGTWARGMVAMDAAPVAPRAIVQPNAVPRPAMPAGGASAPQPIFAKDPGPAVTKEDMQRALDAVRARRTAPTLQAKPDQREAPLMPALEADLEDVVEDEEAMTPPVKREGFGALPGDKCPSMGTLVQRRDAPEHA